MSDSEIGDAFNPDSRLARHNEDESDLEDPEFDDTDSSGRGEVERDD